MKFYMIFAGESYYPSAGMSDYYGGYAFLESAEKAFDGINTTNYSSESFGWKKLYGFHLDSLKYELIKSEGHAHGD